VGETASPGPTTKGTTLLSRAQGSGLPSSSASSPAHKSQKSSLTSTDDHSCPGVSPSSKVSRPGSLTAWITQHAAVPATVAVISRVRWITLVTAWAATPDGRTVLARYSLRSQRFVAIAGAMARHCDGVTGPNIAAGNHRLASEAGCSVRLVTTTRRILVNAGWLYKSAERVCSRIGRFNRPAVVHLTIPRPTPATSSPAEPQQQQRCHATVTNPDSSCAERPVDPPTESGRVCELLRSTYLQRASTGCSVAGRPKTRSSALRKPKPSKTIQERRRRFLAYQIADELIDRTVGLQGARGPVAAALTLSSLDLVEAWTAVKLKAALDVCGVSHRIDWPGPIRRPGRGEPADAVTVAAELDRRGLVRRIGGAPYLHMLIAPVPTAPVEPPVRFALRACGRGMPADVLAGKEGCWSGE
jgi:hypothetical protein